MRRQLTAWAILGLVPVALSAAADEGTVKKEDVKTWTATVDGKEREIRPATPNYFGDTGLFHLSTAYTLPKGKASFSLFRDNLDRDPKDLDISIHGLSVGYGATARIELFGMIGLQNRVRTAAPFQGGFVNDFPFAGGTFPNSTTWETGFGDIRLGAKYKFLDDYQGDGVGLAVKGYVKLPTADETKGLGTGKASFGGDVILSKSLNRGADVHASIGYQFNGDPDSVNIGNAFNWGLGFNLPALRILQLQAELTGSGYSGADFAQTKPLDLIVGPVVFIKPGFFIRPAVSWNLNFDDRGLNSSSKSYTGRQIAIGYHPGTLARRIEAPPPPPPPPAANRPPTVSVTCEKPVILPGETVRCHASASDPDGDPLSYAWSSSNCRISGNGADATLDCTGVPAGTNVTVTVRVSDGRGGTAEASTSVRVEAPTRRPEAQTLCDSAGFPRNLSRLNNIDKACLDDVASRLRQDPRSRVVVVGHADKSERFPDVVGRKRAEEVKDYLVKQRGVDESRISVRSAGANQPVDTGASIQSHAKNRRVQVIFVPEGASVPEDDD